MDQDFLQLQGYKVEQKNQVNKSTILIKENGKDSPSKRTRHLNIRCFFLVYQVKEVNFTISY